MNKHPLAFSAAKSRDGTVYRFAFKTFKAANSFALDHGLEGEIILLKDLGVLNNVYVLETWFFSRARAGKRGKWQKNWIIL